MRFQNKTIRLWHIAFGLRTILFSVSKLKCSAFFWNFKWKLIISILTLTRSSQEDVITAESLRFLGVNCSSWGSYLWPSSSPDCPHAVLDPQADRHTAGPVVLEERALKSMQQQQQLLHFFFQCLSEQLKVARGCLFSSMATRWRSHFEGHWRLN